ncbi:MAG: glycosyltransferase family 2 protein [Hyphomicrobiales bacterium]|jgi:glycosyltransferase involved in cell wall biosynthesis|nr:glycosyltransferase family 2 protein [Hyphomicrobiales bacterium]
MNKLPISCTIISLNEADRIGKAIESVKSFADEIIVIDSGSIDGTQKICSDMGCFVRFNKWQGYGPQKRFAEDIARNDWILNLDADEYLSIELVNEITDLFNKDLKNNFYEFKVIPIYPNWEKPRLFSAYHKCVRLYNKKIGRFSESPVHDSVVTKDHPIEKLQKPIYHKSIRSFKHLIEKQNSYIKLQADTLKRKKNINLILRFFIEFPFAFLKYYIVRRHITGGLTGLKFSLIISYIRLKRIILFIMKK